MSRLRIAFSACLFHADPARPLFKGKTLLYAEQSLMNWVLAEGALGLLVPPQGPAGTASPADYLREADALVLQGGADVSPKHYGETPLRPEWEGDYVRDCYEIALVHEALAQGKPILGICRGAQLLNVALGGSLYQDIVTQMPGAFDHRVWETYDQNFHEILLEPGSQLARLYGGLSRSTVNSVHHQALRTLGKGLRVEARGVTDGVIEAVRLEGPRYAVGLQWHPEFQDPTRTELLNGKKVLADFLDAAASRRG